MDYEDDTIIGTFHSRVADAKKQENEMRLALNVIGLHRSSQKIQMTASQVPQSNIGVNRKEVCSAYCDTAINNYEEALLYLGAEHSTTDDYVEVLHTLKVSLSCSFIRYHPHPVNVKLHFCQDMSMNTKLRLSTRSPRQPLIKTPYNAPWK